jgi:hypothetical protein
MSFLTVLYKIVGFLSIPLLVVSTLMVVRSIRRAHKITSRSLVFQLAFSPAFLILYSLLLGVTVAVKWAAPLMMLGIGLGSIWAQSTDLSLRGGRVYGSRSVWYLLVWCATYAVTQLLALFGTDGAVAGGLATMIFSTGSAIGMNGNLLLRRSWLLSASPGTAAP